MEISRIIRGIIMFALGIGMYIFTIVTFCNGGRSIESTIGIILGGVTIGTALLGYGWAIMFENY